MYSDLFRSAAVHRSHRNECAAGKRCATILLVNDVGRNNVTVRKNEFQTDVVRRAAGRPVRVAVTSGVPAYAMYCGRGGRFP